VAPLVNAEPVNTERDLLQRLAAGPATGDALARAAGHTRAAIWKRIDALRAAGVAIEARAGRGYALAQPLDLLDAEAILAQLPARQRAGVAELEIAWSLDSSNSELLRRKTPATGAAVLLAERQTGGRGRRGSEWASPLAANLYLSIARYYSGGLARLGGLSLVAGIAAVEALHALGIDRVGLKWPNDLVVDDADGLRKLGGLLVEGGGEHAGPVRAVVGLGLNLRMPAAFAARIDQPWIDVDALCGARSPTRNALAAVVIEQLLAMLERFDAEGFAPFRAAYRSVDALAGREVVVRAGEAIHAGTALGIGDDGALQVRSDDRVRELHAGEVSVRRQ
jgi:BirA family transcriptional regulator, biotin operon repressor / biotin---[acetyl-CoA-carboxylase] ligase